MESPRYPTEAEIIARQAIEKEIEQLNKEFEEKWGDTEPPWESADDENKKAN